MRMGNQSRNAAAREHTQETMAPGIGEGSEDGFRDGITDDSKRALELSIDEASIISVSTKIPKTESNAV
jgi:hypothetical protein